MAVFDEEIKLIRKALKKLAKSLSVRRGRGTAYGWIEIWGSLEFGEFTEEEREALERFGIPAGGNCAVISPDDRRWAVERACKILGVELPEVVAKEYREKDEFKMRMEERLRIREQERKEMEKQGYEQCPICGKWFDPNDMVIKVGYLTGEQYLLCKKCRENTLIIG